MAPTTAKAPDEDLRLRLVWSDSAVDKWAKVAPSSGCQRTRLSCR